MDTKNRKPAIDVVSAKIGVRRTRGRISIFEQAFGSEGTIENSPAFQCRERLENVESRRDG
jgi:hypothetical protein